MAIKFHIILKEHGTIPIEKIYTLNKRCFKDEIEYWTYIAEELDRKNKHFTLEFSAKPV